MKMKILAMAGVAAISMLASCNKDLVTYRQGDICVSVEAGDAWLHDFRPFAGIKTKNPPQIAIWVEDAQGNYLSTIYATQRIATEGWRSNKGNRRKEALPVWCHVRGVQYPDGLYLPTKDQPLTDGISGATPKADFDVKLHPVGGLRRFVVKVEVNHSTDWNDSYPKDAAEGTPGWSGDSGQPALVYAAEIDLSSGQKEFIATLVGHSSPDGSNGDITADTSLLSSALNIVKQITIEIK